jgi:hypothetical protein
MPRGPRGEKRPADVVGTSRRETMPTADEYRQYAKKCDRLAHESNDKLEQATLRQIATQWRRLANRLVKQKRRK